MKLVTKVSQVSSWKLVKHSKNRKDYLFVWFGFFCFVC